MLRHDRPLGRLAADNTAPQEITGSVSDPLAVAPLQLAVLDGRLHVVYRNTLTQPPSTWYATDSSGGWRFEQVAEEADSASFALSADGVAHVAVSSGDSMTYRVTSPSGSFAGERLASRGWMPALTLDEQGQPFVVFTTEAGTWLTSRAGREWTSPLLVTEFAGVDHVALDRFGRAHVLYTVYSGRRRAGVWYASSADAGADPRRIRGQPNVADAPGLGQAALAVDAEGRPHVVFAILFDAHDVGLWYTIGPPYDDG